MVFKSSKSQAMKGFGNNDRTNKKSTEKRVKSFQKDELISNALSLHSSGKIKEASKIYNFLIQNKIYDPRVINNLGSIYSQIKEFDKAILLFHESIKKLGKKIPTVAYMREMATSGGYLVSLSSDRIFGNEGTITGSIGVILQTADISQLLNKLGINPVIIKRIPPTYEHIKANLKCDNSVPNKFLNITNPY